MEAALPTNGMFWSREFIGAVKTCLTCEIAVLDGNFEHKILIFRENPFHVTILTFSDLQFAIWIDLIGPREDGVLKICLWFTLVRGYVTVPRCGCVGPVLPDTGDEIFI